MIFSLSKRSIIGAFCALLLAANSAEAHETPNVSIYYSYEANGADYISGIGTGFTLKDQHSNFGVRFDTSINYAEIITTDGYLEDYMAWEGSVRFGYFSDVFVYGEFGIDLTELLFQDWRYDNDYYYNDYGDNGYYDEEYNDDIDAFVGAGIGVKLGKLSIEGFTRLREIDSRYWEAESEVFSGVKFSINF